MPVKKLAFDFSTPKTLHLKLSGHWLISTELPEVSEVTSQFATHADIKQVIFDASQVFDWDSSLLSFLLKMVKECHVKGIEVIRRGLPEGMEKLLAIALKVSGKEIPHKIAQGSFLEMAADKVLYVKEVTLSVLDFLGEIAYAFVRLFRGKAYFRWEDFWVLIQRCGASALGLVSMISILVGIIFAFIGAIQLRIFGAQIYVADIVGIAMVRVMGAVMTGILMSGRTGAAFAAELGIMQTNEEIDALKTLGINPIEFLVMPRVLALVIMMPLLTLYADLMGIFGGFITSLVMLDLNAIEYLNHTQTAVKLNYLWIGLVHSVVFGTIVAVTGCLSGIKCERSANGVGEATTHAVVNAITSIVIATAIITFICQILGV